MKKSIAGILGFLGLKNFFKQLLKYTSNSYWKNRDTLFLIHTMGKVGGTSVTHTVRHNFKYSDVFHIHYFSKYWLGVAKGWDPSENNNWNRKAHLVRPYLDKAEKVKMISIVRDPVSIHISGEFENSIQFGDELINTEPSEIISYIRTKGFDYPTKWFNDELLTTVGIDISEIEDFSNKGFTVFNKGRFSVLILKFETLNEIAPTALSEFLGTNIKMIAKRNRTSDKPTNKLYEKVKSEFTLSEEKLETIYNQPILQLVYSEKEIETFKNRWRG